jgi:hypothetical protein
MFSNQQSRPRRSASEKRGVLSIAFPEDLRAAVIEAAEREHRTPSSFVRHVVAMALQPQREGAAS